MEKTYNNDFDVLKLIKAVILAVLISLVSILIGAFVIKMLNIADDYVSIVNYIIKVFSVVSAVLLTLRKTKKAWLKGIIVGLAFAILAYFVYSLLQAKFNIGFSILSDLFVCSLAGFFGGIITSIFK